MIRRNSAVATVLVFVISCNATAPALGWHSETHEAVARYAVIALPETMPAFFRDASDAVASIANDPDDFKHPQLPSLRAGERPEHYFDLELLKDNPIPNDRYSFIELCKQLGIKPNETGTLPYAVAEWTDRLALAFAQHRENPNDTAIRMKCLVYAGLLSHYAADLCQPLHTTIHFDGRATADGKSPRSGIHHKVDALPMTVGLQWEEECKGIATEIIGELLPAIVAELHRAHALVDRVYELEQELPLQPGDPISKPVRAFAAERFRASTLFTARLFHTAWVRSQTIKRIEHPKP